MSGGSEKKNCKEMVIENRLMMLQMKNTGEFVIPLHL